MHELHCIVHGKVQGVRFRAFAQREAEARGITGYVRNREDGTVEVCAQGTVELLHELHEKLTQGPFQARVDQCDVSWGEPTNTFSGFEVRA